MATPADLKIPCTPKEWADMAAKFEVPQASVNSTEVMQSGSSVSIAQFLSFRILWSPSQKYPNIDLDEEDDEVKKAAVFLLQFKEFQAYLNHVKSKLTDILPASADSPSLGIFQGVRKYQLETGNVRSLHAESDRVIMGPAFPRYHLRPRARMSRSPSVQSGLSPDFQDFMTPTTPAGQQDHNWDRTADEQIVNMALNLYLDAITLNITPRVRCGWSVERLAFKVGFEKASMEARTDGFLYGPNNGKEAFAIVEVKAGVRKRDTVAGRAVYMQESAEMLSWIRHDQCAGRKAPLPKRLLVSQDRHEIWLTTASFDDNYLAYLDNRHQGDPGFLKMEEVGPFDTLNHKHMIRFAKHIILFCNEVSAAIRQTPLQN